MQPEIQEFLKFLEVIINVQKLTNDKDEKMLTLMNTSIDILPITERDLKRLKNDFGVFTIQDLFERFPDGCLETIDKIKKCVRIFIKKYFLDGD